MSERITIVVRETRAGEEWFFKMKQTTAMRKLFHSFAKSQGVVDRGTLMFFLANGTEIGDDDTPHDIGLRNQDRINVLSLRQWFSNELDASRQIHDRLQEQHAHLQEQLDSLKADFMTLSFNKRDADESKEKGAKRRRSK